MAAVNHSSSAVSWAAIARAPSAAATSQTSASKAAPATAPANASILSDMAPAKTNWADDVESSVSLKSSESQQQQSDELRSSPAKESTSEHTKSEEKVTNGASSVSSPDLAASVSSTTKDEYDVLSPPNGSSSESTWEMASQASESWIIDREKKQSASQTRERSVKDERKGKDGGAKPVPKPVILQDAPPPSINPWLKRAEDAKAKSVAQPPRSPGIAPPSDSSTLKENQRPRADSRRKANSVASIPPESLANGPNGLRSESSSQNKQVTDSRSRALPSASDQESKSAHGDTSLTSKAGPIERQSLPNLSAAPTIAADEASWPTPETAQEKERKDSAEKDVDGKREEEATPTTKRKKPEWKVIPVTPTFKFETQINERNGKPRSAANGERGGRGGASSRGRGGHRGGQNGANGSERQNSRTGSSPNSRDVDLTEPRGRPSTSGNESAPSQPKRASSENSWHEQKPDAAAGRSVSGQATTESTVFDQASNETNKAAFKSANIEASPATRWHGGIRSESPSKLNDTNKDTLRDPSPIPRSSFSGAQPPAVEGGADNATRDMPPPRMGPAESRREARSLDNSREATGTIPRGGGRRGGRGRGGARDFLNGQSNSHPYTGTYTDFLNSSGAYSALSSNSTYPGPRGNHQYNFAIPNRGGWNNRGGGRSQSIPIENNYYPRSNQHYGGIPAPLNIPQYQPGMFDYPPMTAMPYPNQMDTQYVVQMVATQLDYYFSVDNLLKDMFLRKHMDSQGFVFMDVVANFNRVRQLTPDRNIIKMACMNSSVIEIRVGDDGRERLRKAEGWEQFLLPMEQREESAQNNGPEHSQRPEKPQLQIPEPQAQFRGPSSAGNHATQHARLERRSYDSAYPSMNGGPAQYGAFDGIPEVMYGEMNGGEELRGRAAKSPIHETPVSPLTPSISATVDEADIEPDIFPDSQAELLTVVVKLTDPQQAQPSQQQSRPPQISLSSRTFSNGSIDAQTILKESDEQALVNGTDNVLIPVQIPRRPSPNKPRSGERAPSDPDVQVREVRWVKDEEVSPDQVRKGLTTEPYLQLRAKALNQRNQASTGNCPYDMDVLYQFWCHFLIRNFNNNMYSEFMTLANEDAKSRHSLTGMQNLLKFYDHSFRSKSTIRNRIVQDYVRLVKNDPTPQSKVFKQLRAAWRDGAISLKNRKKLLDLVDRKFADQLEMQTLDV